MDIVIRTVGLKLTDALEAAIEEKIGRAEHFGPIIVRARVFVHKDSAHTSTHQYSVRVVCEVRGADLAAEDRGPDPISALDIVAEKIERQLRKRKTHGLAKRAKNGVRRKD